MAEVASARGPIIAKTGYLHVNMPMSELEREERVVLQLAGHARAARRGQRAAAPVVGQRVRRVAAGGHLRARLRELPRHAHRPAARLPGQAGPARRRRVHRHQVSTYTPSLPSSLMS